MPLENQEPKYRVYMNVNRLSLERYSKLEEVSTGNVVDAMGRFGAMHHEIRPLDANMRLLGSAITVKARPCDNLIVYKALELIRPGDVLVIAVEGYTTNTVWGDLTSMIAKQQEAAGIVTDGMVRDIPGIKNVGVPVFCRGVTPNSPFKDGPGEINVPLTCGGVTVFPGDIIIGDQDGVVVIPQNSVDHVVKEALEIQKNEQQKEIRIEKGLWRIDGIDDKLKAKGCTFIDE